ncbi:uncharacterized protein C8A04DRAFT_15279, partial [Dichotomopilus funicola]
QTALFNFTSLLLVILLLICTCAYLHQLFPAILDRNKTGIMGIFWKCARIGERLSPYMSLCCGVMAVSFHHTVWFLVSRCVLTLSAQWFCGCGLTWDTSKNGMHTIDDGMSANKVVAVLLDLDFRRHVKYSRVQNGVGDCNAA